jgi:hypothetical protein
MNITIKVNETLPVLKCLYRYHFEQGANDPVSIMDIENWLAGMLQADIDDINSDDEITEG